jgi:hypothetical protein
VVSRPSFLPLSSTLVASTLVRAQLGVIRRGLGGERLLTVITLERVIASSDGVMMDDDDEEAIYIREESSEVVVFVRGEYGQGKRERITSNERINESTDQPTLLLSANPDQPPGGQTNPHHPQPLSNLL